MEITITLNICELVKLNQQDLKALETAAIIPLFR